MDIRGQLGAWAVKFLKLGRLTFGSPADVLSNAFDKKRVSEETLWKAYEENVWVYRGIGAIASSLSQLPIKVFEKTAAGALSPIEKHDFYRLIDTPNKFMTSQDLVEYLTIFLESTGDGYWLFDDLGASGRSGSMKLSQVKELWPIPSQQMTAVPDTADLIAGYDFKPTQSGKAERLSVAEVLHVRYPAPATLLYGQGGVRPMLSDIASESYAAAFERFIMKNLASNIVFLKTDAAFTPDQREEYRRSLAMVFRGVKVGFMENGLDFATPQIAAKDLPFMQLDERRQKRVMASLGVPPVVYGSQDAKYDNAEQQFRVFWDVTLLPKAKRIGDQLTKKLRALGESDRIVVQLDTSGVKALQADFQKQAEIAKVWVGLGVPLNNAIKVFAPQGIDEVEGGDVGLVDAGKIPIEDAIDPPDPAVDPEGTPEDAPAPGDEPKKKPKPGEDKPDDGKALELLARAAEGDGSIAAEAKDFLSKSQAADKALDDAHWKRFIVTSEPGFRRLRAEMRRYFKAQKAEVLARIAELDLKNELTKDARIALILLDENAEAKKLAKRTTPIIKAIYRKLGEQAVADVGASISFNIASVRAQEFLSDHVFQFSFQVNKTTRARLTSILQEKFAEGVPQQELTDAIVSEFQFAERYRAARIARTESGIAGNMGTLDGMVQAGVERKRWVSSRDEKVRDSHVAADQQEVGIDEPFDVGGALLDAPGDPSGPPEEIINCRCTLVKARERSE